MIIHKYYKWGFLFAFLLLLIVGVVITGKGDKNSRVLETVLLGDLVQQIDDFHLFRFIEEDVEWELKAKSSVMHNGEEDALVRDINIVYIPKGETPIRLSAEKGKYDINKNTFFVEGGEEDVDIKIGKGIAVRTKSLKWLGENKEIHSSGRVQVVGEKFILEGEDLTAFVDNGVYEINKNIHATIWE